jgi:hypothetical protein
LIEYDAYAKPLEDFRVKTTTGAAGIEDLRYVKLI